MLGRTHIAFGILCATIVAAVVNIEHLWLFYACTLFGALLPDIDHTGSTINKLVPITKIFGVLFKHRGFFHSVFPVLIIYGTAYSFGHELVGVYLGFGYLTHLIGDSMTKLGVNYLHPFSTLHARGFLEVGTIEETLFFIAIIVATVALLVM